MGRRKTIRVDVDKLLVAILTHELTTIREIDSELSGLSDEAKRQDGHRGRYGYCDAAHELKMKKRDAVWVPYRVAVLVGRRLTNSELVRHREALREMSAARPKLLDLDPPRKPNAIRLTRRGRERAREILAKKKS